MINMGNREEIRTKWIRHKPLMKLDECVDSAMQEYSDQQSKSLLDEIEMLKFQLKAADSVNENLSKAISDAIESINEFQDGGCSKNIKDAKHYLNLTNQNK